MADHQDPASALRRLHRPFGLGGVRGERLLDEAVLARFQHAHRELAVRGNRRRERDRVERRVTQELADVIGHSHARESRRDPLARLTGRVAAPGQLASWDRVEVAGDVRAPVAKADDADPDWTRVHPRWSVSAATTRSDACPSP